MKDCLNLKWVIYFVSFILAGPSFAGDESAQFKADEFIEYLKKQQSQNMAVNLVSPSFKRDEIKYTSGYMSGQGKGYYLSITNTRSGSLSPEYWGPYKTRGEAEEAKAGLPKSSVYKVANIEFKEGAYSNSSDGLKSLLNSTDRTLSDCYKLQLKEVEKIKSDDQLNSFFKFLMTSKNPDQLVRMTENSQITIQLLDLRTGVPGGKIEQPLGGTKFRITAMLDEHGNCRVTTLQDLQFRLNPHIEQYKKSPVEKTNSEKEQERLFTFNKILNEQHFQLLKQIVESQRQQALPPEKQERANTGTGV